MFPLPQLSRIKIACCRVETEEEFRTTMEKIPDYRIREEDVRNILISNLLLFPSSPGCGDGWSAGDGGPEDAGAQTEEGRAVPPGGGAGPD